ncbi:MAG TPA: gliding motility-associated C-terminal domain-containing protein [Bacteroidia bacterium]|nr:gliding motility-associated C-terminal domain-containing protein [Bacteroidia bacterium]
MAYYLCVKGPEFKLIVPNVFTPNSDYTNDNFVPAVTNEICLDNYYMAVYTRWGMLIYESTVYSVGWNGNTFYGDPYPEGTYYYMISYSMIEPGGKTEKSVTQKGFLLLAR